MVPAYPQGLYLSKVIYSFLDIPPRIDQRSQIMSTRETRRSTRSSWPNIRHRPQLIASHEFVLLVLAPADFHIRLRLYVHSEIGHEIVSFFINARVLANKINDLIIHRYIIYTCGSFFASSSFYTNYQKASHALFTSNGFSLVHSPFDSFVARALKQILLLLLLKFF